MKLFLRLLSYAKPVGRYWPLYFILSVFSVIFSLVNYALIRPLIDVLFQPESVASQLTKPVFSFSETYFNEIFQYYLTKFMLESGPLKGLVFVCIIFIIASLFSNLTRYFSQRILVTLKVNLMKNIREDLFDKISRLHIGYFHSQRKGDILSSISNDVNEVQVSVASSFHIIFREPLMLIGFLSGLFYMSPQLTFVTLLTLPISAIIISRISRSLKRGARDTQSIMGRILSHFEETISGARIIKAFNAQRYVKNNFGKSNEEHRQSSRRMYNKQELASPLSEFLGIAVAGTVLFYGGYLNLNGKLGMSQSEFLVYILFYWRVLEPAKAITNAYANIQRGLASGERIFAIMDVEPQIKKAPDAISIKEFKDRIEFKNVDFKYSNEPVLKDININIERGKMVALVGPSGAGKSTIADLIPRFYDVTGGAILLDGIDIRKYQPKELISLMGIVTQEAILFNDTVYNNIVFGLEGVTPQDVESAARIANAHEFIEKMDDGYQTNIGDRGSKLSGGQRQRLAIARAVLKNPPILILDEATSALDTESERLVQDALTNLMKNRTSIVIAHRLSTIQHADEIIVLQKGEIVERGTHHELIKNRGVYSHLCELQTFA